MLKENAEYWIRPNSSGVTFRIAKFWIHPDSDKLTTYLQKDGLFIINWEYSNRYKSAREAIGVLKKFVPNIKRISDNIKSEVGEPNRDDIIFK